jgi:hypothetical protein
MKAKMRDQLDRLCEEDNILSLSATCHPDAPLLVHYDRATGTLLLHCSLCAKPVDAIAVRSAATAKPDQG